MVKGIDLLISLVMGTFWALTFKFIDPSMTVFQTAVIGLLTANLFNQCGSKE